MPASLLERVAEVLRGAGIPHALIGAAAMALHGFPRATRDTDLLTLSRASLEPSLWQPLRDDGAKLDIRPGDDDDPLAGVVRIAKGRSRVDVVVGRGTWQRDVIAAAVPAKVSRATVPVVTPAGLVLLKLHAGGFKDRWDIAHILESAPPDLMTEIDRGVLDLPPDAQALWAELRAALTPT